ncbi:Addiction module antidote protein [Nitrospira sp. KM1]|uniref:helix-turn-helix domain-containing transcriptional regulator n=1 Tax=Nitrospira sp. KM1 TaxID=1936990 RepID=UPI0013A72C34|nr:transcriptional regulator [Nitrospira sp. KM1]BCA56556.1 Addiction module antidote protein [Nitrospira sp. KM1]
MKKSSAYQAKLIKTLRDVREAEEYLKCGGGPQGDMAQLADKTKLDRESLYKMLPPHGNPEFRSLDILLHALGFRLAVTVNR